MPRHPWLEELRGNLARRGVKAVMPDMETFPYVIRVVSEILESNGSSSMASVCGTVLSLMDAGVPVKAPVASPSRPVVPPPPAPPPVTKIASLTERVRNFFRKLWPFGS